MKRFMLGVVAVLSFVAVGIASAPPLTFTYSDPKANKTATETDTYGINNAGAIAGDYVDSAGVQHAMVLAGKKLTSFAYKNCTAVTGTGGPAGFGINKSGEVAGWCTNSNGIFIGWTWTAKGFVDVNFPKGTGTEVTGVNDKGDLTGLYFDSAGLQHGFVKKVGGKFKSFDVKVKGTISTGGWAINNAGIITVQVVNSAGTFDGYTYNGTTFKKVDVKGATSSIIHGNNNKGDIVFTFADSAGAQHGALLHAGKFYTLDHPKAVAPNGTRADGINDTLVIVGRYSPADGSSHGFKAVTKQ